MPEAIDYANDRPISDLTDQPLLDAFGMLFRELVPDAGTVMDLATQIAADRAATEDARDEALATDVGELAPQVTYLSASFKGQVNAVSTARGVLFARPSLAKPWIKRILARIDLDGMLHLRRIRLANGAPTASRWIGGMMSSDGKRVILGVDRRERVRALLDERSVAYIGDQLGDVGGLIDPADLPLINGKTALLGWAGEGTETYYLADGNIGPLFYRRASPSARILPCTRRRAEIALSNGQSLGQGGGATADDAAGVTTVNPYPELDLMMSGAAKGTRGDGGAASTAGNATGLVPAVEFYNNGDQGETPATQAMAAYQREVVDAGLSVAPIAYRAHGQGGQPMSVIKKGGTGIHYANGMADATKFVQLYAAVGYAETIVRCVDFIHGEQDRGIGTARASYRDDLVALAANYNTDLKAITGQSEDVILNVVQLAAWTKGQGSTGETYSASQISQAQVDAMDTSPLVQICCPGYIFPRIDGVHLKTAGYKLMGEYIGRARAHVRRWGTRFQPLRVTSATLNSDTIDLRIGGGSGALQVFSADWLPQHTTLGFQAGSDSGAATITDVTFPQPRLIRLKLSAPLAGANPFVAYAYDAHGTASADNYAKAFGNIADTAPGWSQTTFGRPLHNFLLAYRGSL